MRASSATLTDTSVRLWDLVFPSKQVLLARTRAAFVHLDNLIAFSKRDRDGRVDAYLACYRPDETLLLFFARGDLVNATAFASAGRYPLSINEALRHIRAEPERAEIAFHEAPAEQLAAMYATCSQEPEELALDAASPDVLFKNLFQRKWSGLLELISRGRVSYLTVKEGRFASGRFADQAENEDPRQALVRQFATAPPLPAPKVAARALRGLDALPVQASPALVQVFRQFAWDLVDLAEREVPGDAARRAEKARGRLTERFDVLRGVGGERGMETVDPICEPQHLSEAVAAWIGEFLGELEIVHPQIAPRLVKEAGREQRYALAAVGFFEKLPWRIEW